MASKSCTKASSGGEFCTPDDGNPVEVVPEAGRVDEGKDVGKEVVGKLLVKDDDGGGGTEEEEMEEGGFKDGGFRDDGSEPKDPGWCEP